MKKGISLIIILIILFFIVLLSEYTIYSSLHTVGIINWVVGNNIYTYIVIIFPLLFIASMMYSYKRYSLLNSYINNISALWLGIVCYLFIASVFISLLIIINIGFNIEIPIVPVAKIIIAITLLIIFYGILNSNNPRIVRWGIVSEKLSKDWKDKKIVIISDVHLGSIRREGFLKKVIYKIEKERPDVVFILGDLIDGSVFPYKKWLEEFSSIKPEFGIIYVEGNHEKFNQEYDKFKSEIPDSITNITNKKININNTQIIGLDYHLNESKEDTNKGLESLGYEQDKPSIVLIHEPKNIKCLADKEVSLVMSGHTHGGQLFPFTLLIKRLYRKYTHSVSYTKDTISLTSYGVGTAMIPMRIGTIPEIIVLVIE